LPAILA